MTGIGDAPATWRHLIVNGRRRNYLVQLDRRRVGTDEPAYRVSGAGFETFYVADPEQAKWMLRAAWTEVTR